MKQAFTEAKSLILEMGGHFKPYIIVCLKQRLEIEEIISTFEAYLHKHESSIVRDIVLFPNLALNDLFLK